MVTDTHTARLFQEPKMQDMDVRLVEDVTTLFHDCNDMRNNLHQFTFLTPCGFEQVIQVMLGMWSLPFRVASSYHV